MEEFVDQASKLLHLNSLDDSKELAFIEKKLGVKPSALVIAAGVFLLIVTFLSNATSLVVGVGCCLVPAYFTFLALESGRKALKKYLIYWIAYATLQLFGPLLTLLLPSFVYILLRVGITVALLHPESQMAGKIYDDLIGPFLRKYERQIDHSIDNAVEKGRQGFKKGKNYVQELVEK